MLVTVIGTDFSLLLLFPLGKHLWPEDVWRSINSITLACHSSTGGFFVILLTTQE